MRLISAKLKGYRRFADAKVNLDADLLAVVGPNEAGKSTLFEALRRLENDDAIPPMALTRGLPSKPSGSDAVVKARYLLEEQDRQLLNNFPLEGKPRWFVFSKLANGSRRAEVEPSVKRDVSTRQAARDRLIRTARNTHLKRFLEHTYAPAQEPQESQQSLRQLLRYLVSLLDTTSEDLNEDIEESIRSAQQGLQKCLSHKNLTSDTNIRALRRTQEHLQQLKDEEFGGHPRSKFLERLRENRPQFAEYTESQRQLQSEYSNSILTRDLPDALANLFELSGVSPRTLRDALEEGDHGRIESLEERANANLEEQFDEAWSQSAVYPRFAFQDDVIRVFVPTRGTYSPIAERSDGLRSFVALCAFAAVRRRKVSPILLIDEVESHLHYDAQADLIGVLERQEVVPQIIFSTHSAGCLPNDLGRSVRVIEPLAAESDRDSGRSIIRNSFWEKGAGFSPLMMAMGASVLALVPTRRAVIAEGASETILLPTLLREVTGQEGLEFQVAPGLATVGNRDLETLELEAPVVAYLVDGDDGGDAHRDRLTSAGVKAETIIQLADGYTIEDYIQGSVYADAVNEELRRSYGDKHMINGEELPAKGRAIYVSEWAESEGIDPPSKVNVANRIVESASSGNVVKGNLKPSLTRVHEEIEEILQL